MVQYDGLLEHWNFCLKNFWIWSIVWVLSLCNTLCASPCIYKKKWAETASERTSVHRARKMEKYKVREEGGTGRRGPPGWGGCLISVAWWYQCKICLGLPRPRLTPVGPVVRQFPSNYRPDKLLQQFCSHVLFFQLSSPSLSRKIKESLTSVTKFGWGSNFRTTKCERPIFRNCKIAKIKITKHELFDSFIFEFNFSYFINPLSTQNI